MEISLIEDRVTQNLGAEHILQSFEWGEFKKATGGVNRVFRIGEFEKGKLIRAYQFFIHRLPYLPWTIGYLPRGPIPTRAALGEIKKIARQEKAIFFKIDPGMDEKGGSLGVEGKPIQPRHTIYLDLERNEGEILAGMHPKTRYNIRLAERKGVTVRVENDSEGMDKFVEVLMKTEERQRFYAHSKNYYRKLWETLGGEGMVYVLNAYFEEKVIASIVLFKFKDFLYYPYGGSNYEFRQLMAPQLLHWRAIQLGKKLKCTTYDLWGSYKDKPTEEDPWWGFYRLKIGLGGKEVSFPKTVDIPLSLAYYPYSAVDKLRWKYLNLKAYLR